MKGALLIAIFLVLTFMGIPVGTALGVSGLVVMALFGLGVELVGVNFIAGIASFPLLAIPFFVLSGVILSRAGLARLMAEFFTVVAGRFRGGLATVGVLTCLYWGAISGSGPATAAAVGLLLLGRLVEEGYPLSFAAALVANASALSIVIPPSVAFIVYGNLTGLSVSSLFLAGIVPGLLCGAAYIWVARRTASACVIGPLKHARVSKIGPVLYRSFWALLIPVIILGGIYGGIFTPTEAGVISVAYSLFISLAVYRTLSWREVPHLLVEAGITTSVIMFIVTFAGIFSTAASSSGMVQQCGELILRTARTPLFFILLSGAILLVLGMFLDAISITYIMAPILTPALRELGVDPIGFGVIFVFALAIGQTTPPVGVNLFTVSAVSGTSVDSVARASWPFILAACIVLLQLSIFPEIATFLPNLAGPR